MTSPEQMEPNRRTAALSTAPRTEAGEPASCLNASRQILLTREFLVKGGSKVNIRRAVTVESALFHSGAGPASTGFSAAPNADMGRIRRKKPRGNPD
jgi:hypothetical protein